MALTPEERQRFKRVRVGVANAIAKPLGAGNLIMQDMAWLVELLERETEWREVWGPDVALWGRVYAEAVGEADNYKLGAFVRQMAREYHAAASSRPTSARPRGTSDER